MLLGGTGEVIEAVKWAMGEADEFAVTAVENVRYSHSAPLDMESDDK